MSDHMESGVGCGVWGGGLEPGCSLSGRRVHRPSVSFSFTCNQSGLNPDPPEGPSSAGTLGGWLR